MVKKTDAIEKIREINYHGEIYDLKRYPKNSINVGRSKNLNSRAICGIIINKFFPTKCNPEVIRSKPTFGPNYCSIKNFNGEKCIQKINDWHTKATVKCDKKRKQPAKLICHQNVAQQYENRKNKMNINNQKRTFIDTKNVFLLKKDLIPNSQSSNISNAIKYNINYGPCPQKIKDDNIIRLIPEKKQSLLH